MLTISLGPFAVPLDRVLVMVAALVAAAIGHLVGRSRQTGIVDTLTEMLIAGVIAARVAFVAIWFDTYRGAPWSMLDIRDGGFTPWAGVGAASLLAVWRSWRRPALRKPLAAGLLAGTLAWSAMWGALHIMFEETAGLPQAALTTLAGEKVSLASVADGKPLVVNLWASWCPPCRREMPLLAAEQDRATDLSFVFVNQGEDRAAAERYLATVQLDLANVMLDPGGAFGREVRSAALPTTLFYAADGRLVDTHLGELSTASLASKLAVLRGR